MQPQNRSKGSRLAVLDLGSNTFHLLIVEAQDGFPYFKELYRERRFIYLAKKGLSYIDDSRQDLALECLHDFRELIENWQCDSVEAIGTAALRTASNAGEFLQKIEGSTGIGVKIISGEEEARLIHSGSSLLDLRSDGTQLIMDIGGGSVEFILQSGFKMLYHDSFPFGISQLRSRFDFSEPITLEERIAFESVMSSGLRAMTELLESYRIDMLVGSSGPFEILESMMGDSSTMTGNEYSRVDYERIAGLILAKDLQGRMELEGMPPQRADLSKESFLLIDHIMNRYESIERLLVSPYALKEGVIKKWLDSMT